MEKIRFAILGAKGWRSKFYFRIARALPELFEVCAILDESEERAASIREQLRVMHCGFEDIPIVKTFEELKAYEPDFIAMTVSRSKLEKYVPEATEKGFYVLQETFWPHDTAELKEYYDSVKHKDRVQVAEQYCFQPHHAVRLRVIEEGLLGNVGQVQVSAAHGYHGVSLIRHFLGIGYENCTIRGVTMNTPTSKGPGRNGYPEEETIINDAQKVAAIDFHMEDGSDKWAIFDFTDESYFNEIRLPRVLIRGDRGEADDRSVRTLIDWMTPIDMPMIRKGGGQYGELTEPCIDGVIIGSKWYYRHPWPGARLTDEELAIATVLSRMKDYIETGTPVYSFEEGCQDMYIALLIEEACRDFSTVTSSTQIWAEEK